MGHHEPGEDSRLMSFLAWLLIAIGFLGVILPIIPATPLVAGGIVWLTYLRGWADFSFVYWTGFVLLTGASLAADYVVLPVYVRKRGGSSLASWAAAAGLLVGAFFGLPGLLLGPITAVFLIEWLNKRDVHKAWQLAVHTIIGLLLSAAVKFGALIGMVVWYWVW